MIFLKFYEPLPFTPHLLAVCSLAGQASLSSRVSAPKMIIYEAIIHLDITHQVERRACDPVSLSKGNTEGLYQMK
jgi:hypothetical protein